MKFRERFSFVTFPFFAHFSLAMFDNSFVFFRPQLVLNTAIVYVHRFYVYHSFHRFLGNVSLFLFALVNCDY